MAWETVGGLWKPVGGVWTGLAQPAPPPAGFDFSTLFAGSETGGVWLADDLTRLYTDDGTTNVSADGDLVYRIDSVTTGINPQQANATARPVYKTDGTYHWIEGDGVNDTLMASITPPASTGGYTMLASVRILTAGTFPMILWHEAAALSTHKFSELRFNSLSGSLMRPEINHEHAPTGRAGVVDPLDRTGADIIMTAVHSNATGLLEFRVNGTTINTLSANDAEPMSKVSFLSRDGGLFANARLYGALLIDRPLTAQEVTDAETAFAALYGG